MSEPRFQIVPIAEEHIAGLRPLFDSVAREKLYLAMVKGFPEEETRKFVLGNIKNGVPHFVAIAGGQVVGWCDVLPVPRDAMAHCGVLGMGVASGYRGKGVGSALMKSTLEAARAFGLTRVELTVREDNRRAIALYERFGFISEGIKRNGFRIDGKYHNLLSMAVLF
jgi:ribosomal protein S18 acetylase RimI-like enzyme